MKPSLSIIFFTVSSGAGLGLLALVSLADLCPVDLLPKSALAAGVFLGLSLVVAGLAVSVLHLAKPSNAWRALSRFRTSWLSREAVFAAALVAMASIYGWVVLAGSPAALRLFVAVAVCLLAWIVMICTAMIYASLKPIRQWRTRWTPVNYFLLGHWSGALLLLLLASAYSGDESAFAWLALGIGIAALFTKLGYWRAIADDSSAPTIERAIGVREARWRVDQRRADPQRAILHRLAHQHAHRLELVWRWSTVGVADGMLAQRRGAHERRHIGRDAPINQRAQPLVECRPGDVVSDLALALAPQGASAAAVFTRNQVVAAPVVVGRENLLSSNGTIHALIVNSGNANCATGALGIKAAKMVCRGVAHAIRSKPAQVFPSSTGIIGVILPVEKILAALPGLIAAG